MRQLLANFSGLVGPDRGALWLRSCWRSLIDPQFTSIPLPWPLVGYPNSVAAALCGSTSTLGPNPAALSVPILPLAVVALLLWAGV